MASLPIRQGQVYWIDDCPPLDGDEAKRRPVVVVSPTSEIRRDLRPVIVVAVSTTALERYRDRVRLPNRQDNPNTTSGLPRRCWAIPDWWLLVDRVRLGHPCGFISGVTLRNLLLAFERRAMREP